MPEEAGQALLELLVQCVCVPQMKRTEAMP